MKCYILLLFILCIGICYGYDIPIGVPTEIFGLVITSTANLNIRHDIDIKHPAITALPHYEYLIEPIAIGLEGSGLADIVVAQNFCYTFTLAYYGSAWHKANPYSELHYSDMVLSQVDFEAGSDVILLVCRNDPFMQVVFDSFTAVYNETEPRKVTVTWTTSSETGLSFYGLFMSISNNIDQSAFINEVPATNTNQTHTYTIDVYYPVQGFTNYFWLSLKDNMCQNYFYGPVSVAVGTPHVPANKVPYVVPNPCENEFWCVYELKESSQVSIVLLDSNNNIVKEICHNESMQAGSHLQKVQVFGLPSGLYRIYYWFEQDDGPYYAYGDVLIDRRIGK